MGLLHSILPWTREGRVDVCVLGCTQGGHHPTSNSLHWLHVSTSSSSSSSEFSEKFTCHNWLHVSKSSSSSSSEFSQKFTCHNNNRIPRQQRGKNPSDSLSHKSPICPIHVAGNMQHNCTACWFQVLQGAKVSRGKNRIFQTEILLYPRAGRQDLQRAGMKGFSFPKFLFLPLPSKPFAKIADNFWKIKCNKGVKSENYCQVTSFTALKLL